MADDVNFYLLYGGLFPLLFGGGAGLVRFLLVGKRAGEYTGTLFALYTIPAIICSCGINLSFAVEYQRYIPVIDIFVGFSALHLMELSEKILNKKIEAFVEKHLK